MKKIFILDDNEELLDIMKRILQKEYVVYLKSDSENILREIASFQPDVILLDHYIGNENSGTIIEGLKNSDPSFSTPIILFSAHPQLKQTALTTGAIGYIEKPSEISYIRSYIKRVLGDDVSANDAL